jgi:hypothetical protein
MIFCVFPALLLPISRSKSEFNSNRQNASVMVSSSECLTCCSENARNMQTHLLSFCQNVRFLRTVCQRRKLAYLSVEVVL